MTGTGLERVHTSPIPRCPVLDTGPRPESSGGVTTRASAQTRRDQTRAHASSGGQRHVAQEPGRTGPRVKHGATIACGIAMGAGPSDRRQLSPTWIILLKQECEHALIQNDDEHPNRNWLRCSAIRRAMRSSNACRPRYYSSTALTASSACSEVAPNDRNARRMRRMGFIEAMAHLRLRGHGIHAQIDSTARSGMRSKCRRLLVSRVRSYRTAVAAMRRSMSPIGSPLLRRRYRSKPKRRAISTSTSNKSNCPTSSVNSRSLWSGSCAPGIPSYNSATEIALMPIPKGANICIRVTKRSAPFKYSIAQSESSRYRTVSGCRWLARTVNAGLIDVSDELVEVVELPSPSPSELG